jgi:RNA polymerase sigma-70 factor (ECF subfamily)
LQHVALDQLFRRYSSSVFRRAGAILGDGEAAQDVTQEVFLRAVRAHAELQAADSPLAWLYRVTTNLCLSRLRDVARRQRILDSSAPDAVPAAEHPLDSVLTVRTLMRQVPETLQEIAVYYFVDHLSQDEIAALVGMPRRTVAYRLEQFRARAIAILPRRELAPL